jgi:hypothetical protein
MSALVGSMRRLARERLHADPVLRDEHLRERRTRSQPIWMIVGNVLFGLVIGLLALAVLPVLLILATNDLQGAEVALAFQAYVSTAASFALAWSVRNAMQKSTTVTVLSHLPAADREIPRRIHQEAAYLLPVIAYPLLLLYGGIAYNHGFGLTAWCFSLTLALVQSAVCLGAGTILAAWLPRWVAVYGCVFLIAAFFAYLCLGTPWPSEVMAAITFLFPAGWANAPVGQGLLNGKHWIWLAVLPVILFQYASRRAYARLLDQYTIDEFVLSSGSGVEARLAGAVQPASHRWAYLRALLLPGYFELPPEAPTVLSAAEAARRIRTRAFLDKQDWSRLGWIERLTDHWLSPRERTIVEFLTGQSLEWTYVWFALLWNIPFLTLIYFWFEAQGFLPSFTGALVFCSLFSGGLALSGPWLAFRSQNCGGGYIPAIAMAPVGFDELARTLWKVACVRSLSVFPFLLFGVMMVTSNLPHWPASGILVAVATVGILIPVVATYYLALSCINARLRIRGWRLPLTLLGAFVLWNYGTIGIVLTILGIHEANASGLSLGVAGVLIFVSSLLITQWWYRRIYLYGVADFAALSPSSIDQFFQRQTAAHDRSRRLRELRRRHGWLWWWHKRI